MSYSICFFKIIFRFIPVRCDFVCFFCRVILDCLILDPPTLVPASWEYQSQGSSHTQCTSGRPCGRSSQPASQPPRGKPGHIHRVISWTQGSHVTFMSQDGHLFSLFALSALSCFFFSSSSLLLRSSGVTMPP